MNVPFFRLRNLCPTECSVYPPQPISSTTTPIYSPGRPAHTASEEKTGRVGWVLLKKNGI